MFFNLVITVIFKSLLTQYAENLCVCFHCMFLFLVTGNSFVPLHMSSNFFYLSYTFV